MAHAAEIELKRIPGIREVNTLGGPGHVLRVLMDPEAMNAYRVSAQELRDALQLANASRPAGKLVSGDREVLVQTGTFLASSADVKQLVVGVHDKVLDADLELAADLLVLSARVGPNPENPRLAQLFKVPLNADGFFLEAHAKLRPVEFATDGVYMAGAAHYPQDVGP